VLEKESKVESEGTLERLATNIALLTGAVATLAEAVNGKYAGKPIYADSPAPVQASPQAAPAPRRGRPPKDTPTAGSPAPAPAPTAVQPDPFAATTAAPVATLEDVRTALTALRAATSADQALGVLKAASGVDNLTELQRTPDKYGMVVARAQAELRVATQAPTAATPPAEPDDPFETKAVAATPAKALTLEDVKAACVAAGKRTGQDKVTAIVMEHGGKAPTASGHGPSLKALAPEKYAAVIAAVNALPSTK
jgi:hypothetical protein